MSDIPPPVKILNGNLEMPFDLIENILSRLPVESLKRFRAVEKSWRNLIDSERFAKIHLHRSLTSISNRNLISGMLGFQWMSVDSLVYEAQSINLEFGYNFYNINSISNSCNGLVVLLRDPEPPILLNPFSREHKFLPKCPFNSTSDSSLPVKTTYGFGYDSINDDYKVVQVFSSGEPCSWSLSIEYIYSLKLDCWRRGNGTSYFMGPWPAHVNGVLHTIIQDETGTKIMGFSVETEEDNEVAGPERIDMIMKGLSFMRLDELGGCLALVCHCGTEIVFWVMKEYGVKESWTPLISYPVKSFGAGWLFVRPLAYSKEREKVLLSCDGKGLALCGVRRRKSVEKFAMPLMFWPRLCVESLISPNGWVVEKGSTQKHNKNKEKEEVKKKKNNKKRDDFLSAGFKLVL